MPLGQVLFLQAPIFLNAHAITTIENIFILTATETNEKLGSRHRFSVRFRAGDELSLP